MTKIKDIISIRDDIVFGGAVQTDWFYDTKGDLVAGNFAFHGPDYFGITEEDIVYKDHQLMDTCTFTTRIAEKLYCDEGNPLIMTIAGYGTGKSHLAVTLGKLFSSNKKDEIYKKIIENFSKADNKMGCELNEKISKPNLVLVLNGMRDFNLNYEVLACAKKMLQKHGYSDEFFSDFTKAYSIASIFLNRNYEKFKEDFIREAKKRNITESNLKQYMIDNIYKDTVFDTVNEVYMKVTGGYIRWDEGISAGEVLKKLAHKLCGDNGKFNKILILFDEFGRYIEYASAYPSRAGDSALQQIFEAIQDSNKSIIFVGFIQSDLKTYLSRVNKSSNISRYIGRYEASEKIYLSSNLETIFANIIEKNDITKFNYYITNYFEKKEIVKRNKEMFDHLNKWVSSIRNRGIWKKWDKFNQVIIKGIYPLNPITTLMVTILSDWYQQRSALNFLMSAITSIKNEKVTELGDLPQIFPTEIIKGDFFEELLLAEKEGRQRSENCLLYEKILVKYGEKLEQVDIDVLAGLLIYKLCKFKTLKKEDLLKSLNYITGINLVTINKVIENLEDTHGIISYDSNKNTYDFIEDATGINDFKRFIRKKKNSIDALPIESLINSEIKEKLGLLNNLNSDFGLRNNIKTNEWQYEQDIITVANIDKVFIENLVKDFNSKTTPDKVKGKIIYVYNNTFYELSYLDNIKKLYKKYNLHNYPFIFYLIDDSENKLYNYLVDFRVSKTFTEEEKIKFVKFIGRFINSAEEGLIETFRELQSDRLIIGTEGIIKAKERIKAICNSVFAKLYTEAIPFPFDGFTNKNISTPKKILGNIARSIMSGMLNFQWIQTQSRDVRNRVDIVLKNRLIGWGVIDDDWNITFPTNEKVRGIFNKLDQKLEQDNELNLIEVYNELIDIPYGLNDYSFSLLLAIYIMHKGIETKLKIDSQIIKTSIWSSKYFDNNKLDFNILKRTKLTKIDVKGYLAKYQNLCTLIEKNKDVDKCPELKDTLEKLLSESDPPDELKEKVEACMMLLNTGIHLYNKVHNSIAKAEADLQKGIEEVDFKYIFKAINYTRKVGGYIEEGLNFEYNSYHIQAIKEISETGRKYIEENYMNFVKRTKPQTYAQVSGWAKWMKKLEESLRELGYYEYANFTKQRRLEVTDNLEKIKEQQNALISAEKFLETVNPNEFSSQEELLGWKKEAEKLLSYLDNNKYFDEYEVRQYIDKINSKIDIIKEKLNEINQAIGDILDRAYEIKTIDDGKSLLSNIEYILTKKLRDIDKTDIESIGNILQNFFKDIAKINNIERLTDRLEEVNVLYDKYSEYEDYINIIALVDDYKETILNEIEKLNNIWEKNYLDIDVKDIKKWDSNQCITYIEQTSYIPYYLDEKLVNRYKEVKKVIDNRISSLKIEGVISLFDKLSIIEKEKCLKELLKRI